MKLNLTLRKATGIMKGKLISSHPERPLTSFVTDSRVVGPADAFWALQGANHDARQFVPQAIQQGANVIIAQEEGFSVPDAPEVSFLLVKDSLLALQELAKYHRLHSTLKVAAITGSNGKSTTKQMLRAICSLCGETIANMGNFNNQFGVPFSLLEIQPKHKYGVFELGASHPGDIEETARLALPDVAIITNVSAAHLEFFKDLEPVYKTKTEIVECLAAAGTLIYNSDDEMLARLGAYKGKSISFGFNPRADLRILDTEKFSFVYKDTTYEIDIELEQHNKLNAAAACAAAIALGIFMDQITQGLLSYTPMPMRMERLQRGKTLFILDCYNANPASMQNALGLLQKQTQTPRIAVLGDMKELGDSSAHYHRQVAKWLTENQIDYVFLAGEEMKYAAEALKTNAAMHLCYAKTPAGWMAELKHLTDQGGVCLLKASRGMQFENILKEI